MVTHHIPPFLHSQTCQLIHNLHSALLLSPIKAINQIRVHQLKFPLEGGGLCAGAPIPFCIHTW